jgi:O-methyltransferase involved in polyketide biosynthesis
MCVELPRSQVESLAALGLDPSFDDPVAKDLWQSLERHLGAVPSPTRMRSATARARDVDAVVKRWIARHPGLPVVELGAFLSTRFARTLIGCAQYLTVDEPPVAALRRGLFEGQCDHLVTLGAPLEDASWVLELASRRCPLSVVMESALGVLDPDDVVVVLHHLSRFLPRRSWVVVGASLEGAVRVDGSAPSLRLSIETKQGLLAPSFPALRRLAAVDVGRAMVFEVV